MQHRFFDEVRERPELAGCINFEIDSFPEPHVPTGKIEAILLGADPTNDGIKTNKGLKQLKKVFDIDGEFENQFFGSQKRNLAAVGLSKENVYIQNVCRNYFSNQTSSNKYWKQAADLWLKHLKEELQFIPNEVPVLASSEEIMRVLVKDVPKAETIYSSKKNTPLNSQQLNRDVYPLYRHPKYSLSTDKWGYKKQLKALFKKL